MPEYKLNIVFMALTFAQTCFIIQLTNNYYYHLELYVGLGDRQVVVGGGGGGGSQKRGMIPMHVHPGILILPFQTK